ncbi:TraR/DksA C4-type zinc finger protein [Pluralibacter gergoviae]|nr:TraR/DksA C4-type zinc finger protein [Pluralibacter gergoviae]ELW9444509.1 TraR/DksA C4-type zinc finger protein [Pluralibacter gergoviae]
MADDMDRAQQYELEERERHIRRARREVFAPSSAFCEACDAPIPAARRAAVPGAVFCITCQQRYEQQQRHFRRGT